MSFAYSILKYLLIFEYYYSAHHYLQYFVTSERETTIYLASGADITAVVDVVAAAVGAKLLESLAKIAAAC